MSNHTNHTEKFQINFHAMPSACHFYGKHTPAEIEKKNFANALV